jgi:hypothetical protein
MKPIALLSVAILSGGLVPAAANDLYRPGDGVVLQPAAPRASEPVDPVPAFAKAYARAGRPRIVLYWNRSLSSAIQSDHFSRTTNEVSASARANASEVQAGRTTRYDIHGRLNGSQTITTSQGVVGDNTGRAMPLSERDAAMLEATFMSSIAKAGVNFVDRTMIIRAMAAAEHPTDAEPRLNETRSLINYADLLLQVILVSDYEAPLGSGFRISLTDIGTGEKLMTLYSRAIPDVAVAPLGRWIGTDHGYVYEAPPPASVSAESVGTALGRDVMLTLTQSFGAMAQK